MLNLRCRRSCPIQSSVSLCNAMGSRLCTSGPWSLGLKLRVQDMRNLLMSLMSRSRSMTKMPVIGPRLCLAFTVLVATTTASGADEASHTCVNNGTLIRLAIVRETLEVCILFPKSSILRVSRQHALMKGRNLNKQLLDKPDKLVIREIFEAGRQHKKYESHPAPDVNREKILRRHPFGTDYVTIMATAITKYPLEISASLKTASLTDNTGQTLRRSLVNGSAGTPSPGICACIPSSGRTRIDGPGCIGFGMADMSPLFFACRLVGERCHAPFEDDGQGRL